MSNFPAAIGSGTRQPLSEGLRGTGCRRSQCEFAPSGRVPARCHDSGTRGARPGARHPQARAASPPPRPPHSWLQSAPPAPGCGKGPGQPPDVCAGFEDGCGAQHRAVAAAAAAGWKRGRRGLRLARGALSREARRRRGRAGGLGGQLGVASPPPAAPWAARRTQSKRNCCGT